VSLHPLGGAGYKTTSFPGFCRCEEECVSVLTLSFFFHVEFSVNSRQTHSKLKSGWGCCYRYWGLSYAVLCWWFLEVRSQVLRVPRANYSLLLLWWGDSRHFGPMYLLFLNWCRECLLPAYILFSFLFFSPVAEKVVALPLCLSKQVQAEVYVFACCDIRIIKELKLQLAWLVLHFLLNAAMFLFPLKSVFDCWLDLCNLLWKYWRPLTSESTNCFNAWVSDI